MHNLKEMRTCTGDYQSPEPVLFFAQRSRETVPPEKRWDELIVAASTTLAGSADWMVKRIGWGTGTPRQIVTQVISMT